MAGRTGASPATAVSAASAEAGRVIAAAVAEGRIPTSRIRHYADAWQANPDGTRTLLTAAPDKGGLAPGLPPSGAQTAGQQADREYRDVLAARGLPAPKASTTPPPPPRAAVAVPVRAATPTRAGTWSTTVGDVRIDVFPGGGDVPAATASGIDPVALRSVTHEYARKAIAEQPNRATAVAMLQRYSGPHGEEEADIEASRGGPVRDAAGEFMGRVRAEQDRQLRADAELARQQWMAGPGRFPS